MWRGIIWMVCILLAWSVEGYAQKNERMTREQYVEKYAQQAMKNMVETGIPASITLAQGCLESDNGNSRLAVQANNHFGIKCHEWTGPRIYHDDDAKDECFRKYANAYESYHDHSRFLTGKSRYKELFELKPDDYKGWAKGLQKAGYATSTKYAVLLIKIIEENNLQEYDNMVLKGRYKPGKLLEHIPEISGEYNNREILTNNRVEYILSKQGDTPEQIRREMDLYPCEIYRYNDLERGETLDSGMIVYLQPKRLRAERGVEVHEIKKGETMQDVSRMYAVKLKRLYLLNDMEPGTEPKSGAVIRLRRHISGSLKPFGGIEQGQNGEVEMEFQFDGS